MILWLNECSVLEYWFRTVSKEVINWDQKCKLKKNFLFNWRLQREREWRSFSLLVYSPGACSGQSWARWGDQWELLLRLSCGYTRDPNVWAVFPCLSLTTGKELNWKRAVRIHKLMPTRVAGSGSNFTHCATVLAPGLSFNSLAECTTPLCSFCCPGLDS